MNFKFNIHPCMYTFSNIKGECNSGFNLLVDCTIPTIIQKTICTFSNVQGECKDAGFNLHVHCTLYLYYSYNNSTILVVPFPMFRVSVKMLALTCMYIVHTLYLYYSYNNSTILFSICTFFNVQGECKDPGFNLHVRGDDAESAGLEPPCLLGRNRPLHNRKASFK